MTRELKPQRKRADAGHQNTNVEDLEYFNLAPHPKNVC